MITPIGMIRKLGKMVRGGATPLQIFLACMLGVLVGITPGFNLTIVIGIALFLILNVNLGLTLLGVAIGKGLMYALAPVTFSIGSVLIDDVAPGYFAAIASAPVLALLGWETYCVVGGLVAGVVVGAVLGIALAKAIGSIRRGLLAAAGRSDKIEKAGHSFIVRIILRVLFGKQKKTLAEMMEAKPPLLRKSGIIVLVIVLVVIVAGQVLMAGSMFKGMLKDGLGRANGAQVDVQDAGLSILGGSMSIDGLAMTDRDEPSKNLVQVGSLASDISVSDLLAKRIVIANLSVKKPKLGAKRETPGEVFPTKAEKKAAEAGAAGSAGASGDDRGQEQTAEEKKEEEKKQREQLEAIHTELEQRIAGELDKLAIQRVDAEAAKAVEMAPEMIRERVKTEIETKVKQPLRDWTKQLAKKTADEVMKQLEKEDRFADFANEALKFRKYAAHVELAKEKLAERRAASKEAKKKEWDEKATAREILARKADLAKKTSWLIRSAKIEGLAIGDAGKYDVVADNITDRPELLDEDMQVKINRTDGDMAVELVYGFADGKYHGPTLTISFTLSMAAADGGKEGEGEDEGEEKQLPEWASQMSFECTMTGDLKGTPKLNMNTDKAIADMKAKAAKTLEAEATKRVKKAAKDAIGVDLPGVPDDIADSVKGLISGDKNKKDAAKDKAKDLLKGVLGGDKDKNDEKDSKDDKNKKDDVKKKAEGLLKGVLGG